MPGRVVLHVTERQRAILLALLKNEDADWGYQVDLRRAPSGEEIEALAGRGLLEPDTFPPALTAPGIYLARALAMLLPR